MSDLRDSIARALAEQRQESARIRWTCLSCELVTFDEDEALEHEARSGHVVSGQPA